MSKMRRTGMIPSMTVPKTKLSVSDMQRKHFNPDEIDNDNNFELDEEEFG